MGGGNRGHRDRGGADLGTANLHRSPGSRKTADLIRTQLLPQSQALLRSGVAGYGLGRAELVDVLRAEHDLANLRIELFSAEFDQQRQLAAIERLIGADL